MKILWILRKNQQQLFGHYRKKMRIQVQLLTITFGSASLCFFFYFVHYFT